MSTYKPRHISQDNNISPDHPLKELAWLLAGIVVFVIGTYIILGAVLEYYITNMSEDREKWLWSQLPAQHEFLAEQSKDPALEKRRVVLQKIADNLPAELKPKAYSVKIGVTDDEDINAMAYPGGYIIFTSGLLKELEGKNSAQVFVLGHELGHYKNRDHLRGMGRGLAAVMIGVILTGQNSAIVDALTGIANLNELSHSRHAEELADIHGVNTLMAYQGHVEGAEDFFTALDAMEEQHKYLKYVPDMFSTHPNSDKRTQRLQAYITDNNFPLSANAR